jgi:hypothetical protein
LTLRLLLRLLRLLLLVVVCLYLQVGYQKLTRPVSCQLVMTMVTSAFRGKMRRALMHHQYQRVQHLHPHQ